WRISDPCPYNWSSRTSAAPLSSARSDALRFYRSNGTRPFTRKRSTSDSTTLHFQVYQRRGSSLTIPYWTCFSTRALCSLR
ncbi:unnamed protein product, partial [Nesidiocoris tenuis]